MKQRARFFLVALQECADDALDREHCSGRRLRFAEGVDEWSDVLGRASVPRHDGHWSQLRYLIQEACRCEHEERSPKLRSVVRPESKEMHVEGWARHEDQIAIRAQPAREL